MVPETKNKSLEELEAQLIKKIIMKNVAARILGIVILTVGFSGPLPAQDASDSPLVPASTLSHPPGLQGGNRPYGYAEAAPCTGNTPLSGSIRSGG